MKAMFSCLNLKPDDGFLPHNMPELFNKTQHGLTDIVITWDEFKTALHPQYFWEWYIYLLCARVEKKTINHGWGLCEIFFEEFRVTTLSEKCFSAGPSLFRNLVLKILGSLFGCHTDSLIRIYNTISFSNLATMILVQWLSQIIQHIYWENFSWNFSNWNGVNVQWIYPGSINIWL